MSRTRTQTETDKRPFLFRKALAAAGPTRLTVDSLPRKHTRKDKSKADVVDVTLLPKGAEAQPVTLWCENIGIAEFFAEQENGVPFTVIAEGKDGSAVVTKVGSSVQPPVELPKREEAPPGPRSPDREPTAREARRGPTPHATTRNGQAEAKAEAEMAAAKKARVLIARRVSLRRLCVVAVLACKREYEAMPGVPAMPDESFWQMVTSLYMSAEQEGYDTRMGYGNAMPVALTFDRIAEMAKRKEVAVSEPQRGAEPPIPTATEKCKECSKDCRADGVCINPECKSNDYVPM